MIVVDRATIRNICAVLICLIGIGDRSISQDFRLQDGTADTRLHLGQKRERVEYGSQLSVQVCSLRCSILDRLAASNLNDVTA